MSGEGGRFCPNCGASISADAAFCPRCGTRVGAAPQTPGQPPFYYSRREYRRHEKQEKYEKNEKGEKGRGGGLIGPIIGGLIIIWLGVTFYLQESNIISSNDWWAYFIVGIGAILIVQGLIVYSRVRRPFFGPFIGGVALILIGLSFITNFNYGNFWPLILVVIGAAVIASAFGGRRRRPVPTP